MLLHDLAALTRSKKIILPVSSWAYWAGFFSNASEIHVNAPPHHLLMTSVPNYVYHNQKEKKFFGKYSNTSKDIEYQIDTSQQHTTSQPSGPPISAPDVVSNKLTSPGSNDSLGSTYAGADRNNSDTMLKEMAVYVA
jgi:hypothetical protein